MDLGVMFQQLGSRILKRRGAIKCFEREILAGGGMAARFDAGLHTVEVHKIVGSVGRARRGRRSAA
jgi:hypothetical protein